MAETVGTIQVVATMNTKDYDTGKKQIEKGNEELSSGNDKSSASFNKLKVMAIATATATVAAITAISVSAVKGFADYEQLVGGVDTLFKDSSKTVQKYAENAYKTAGLSANAYMETITGFSASLLQSLGGDTAKAAKIGDMAVTDMADNANKMGTAMGSIQMAYQGFAKQNYTMLDNLKLGYGGTKTEMERLLAEAEKMPSALGRKFDISNYSDVVEAIHVVQTEMGITGTTALEADETISGSFSSMKSAVSNFATGLATPNADMETLKTNVIDTAITFKSNLIPAIDEVIQNLTGFKDVTKNTDKAIGDMIGFINDNKDVFSTLAVGIGAVAVSVLALNTALAVQSLFKAFSTLQYGIGAFMQLEQAGKLVTAMQWLMNVAMSANPIALVVIAITALVTALIWFFTQTELGKEVWTGFMTFLGDVWTNITGFFTEAFAVISGIWGGITGFFTELWAGITGIFTGFISWLTEWGATILAVMLFPFSIILGFIMEHWDAISAFFGTIATWISDFFTNIWSGITAIFGPVVEWFGKMFTNAWDSIKTIWNAVTGFFSGVWNGIIGIFNVVGTWFSGIFQGAWDAIKNVFSAVGGFFTGVWDTIVGIFGAVGTAVGDAIGGTFKNIINTVLKGALSIINGFIDALNIAISLINNIPGVNLGKLGKLPVPQLAEGGIVSKPTLAMVGEGSESEAVIPLSKLDAMLSSSGGGTEYNIGTINIASEVDGDNWLRRLTNNQEITSAGLVPQQTYMGAN